MSGLNMAVWALLMATLCPSLSSAATVSSEDVGNSSVRIRFLVTVNDTWDPDGCMETVATPFLQGGKKNGQSIRVGRCDHGPLVFTVQQGSSDGVSKMNVFLTFHSSVIEDASPPTCNIPWNGTYLNPTEKKMDRSPLPSCFTGDSREGYHMTYYWFRLLEWEFD
ncbi:uncharacterized protein LOC143301527 [Babylonia areolata]|uniref:uncharacterized protein LOC143301527 n=1 Tax=Babylonia areolata TaxID=304850 RepID=UPI003FD5EFBE